MARTSDHFKNSEPPDYRRLGDLKIGDVFRLDPPIAGWTEGKIVIVEKAPGWAMPEGWDFIEWPMRGLSDYTRVELLSEKAPEPTPPVIPTEEE